MSWRTLLLRNQPPPFHFPLPTFTLERGDLEFALRRVLQPEAIGLDDVFPADTRVPSFDVACRSAFLAFFAGLFASASKFVLLVRVTPQPVYVFNTRRFLRGRYRKAFLTRFLQTGAFAAYLQRYGVHRPRFFDPR